VLHRWLAPLLVLMVPASVHAAEPAVGSDDWKYDVVLRVKGPPLSGLVIEQTATHVVMKCISRKPGSPTIVFHEILPVSEVRKVELLDPKDRDQLHKRLQGIARERELLTAQLKLLDPSARPDPQGGDHVILERVPWVRDPKVQALQYRSAHFKLISNAREEVVQLAALLLEQVYAAYGRCLPARTMNAQPTTILLIGSADEYLAVVRERGSNFFNPAFFDVEKNQVVCGCELQRLADELERVRKTHAQLAAELEERKGQLSEIYKGKIPTELLTPITEGLKRIKQTDEANKGIFLQASDRFFRRLYHEAFHAYLNTFVYPPSEGEVPRWLNEGLAQIFETAIVEVGELRIGHPDKDRVLAIRQALRNDTMLPLKELLQSDAKQFLVGHVSDKQVSDRFYLSSWALAFHLTFERKVLGTPAMDEYVKSLKRGTDPLEAFRELVGMPLSDFEKQHLDYLKHLKPEASLGR
jgi:hypothetical protein